jgi:anti-anti-sigma factor
VSSDDERAWRAPPAEALLLHVSMDTVASTVFLHGELDAETAGLLDRAVERQVAEDHVELVVDVAGLAFFDLAGLDALQAAQRRARAGGGRLVVVNHDAFFARVARLCGAESLLDGSPDASGA